MTDQPLTGILIANLGTPDAPTPRALRRYLAEFLGDRRVIEYPRWLWWPILHGIILNVRPRRSARLYKSIWWEEGSPLLVIGERQVAALRAHLAARTDSPFIMRLGMRYGNPSIRHALQALRAAGAQRLLILSLNPQYSATTVGTIVDVVTDELQSWRHIPDVHMLTDYHDHDPYIAALAASVRDAWADRDPPDKLVMSFHGIPQRYVRRGDPYQQHCLHSAQRLAAALDLPADRWIATFQSRFGPEEWLQPYTDETLAALGANPAVRTVDVICPGFAADCLETLEEIAQEGRHDFLAAGGERFHYIPALNDRPDHIRALSDLLLPYLPAT